MRKIFQLLLSFVLVFSMVGCQKNNEDLPIQETHEVHYEAKKYINHYFYDLYNDSKKELYDTIYQAFIQLEDMIPLTTTLNQEEVEEIYLQVLYDHPEIFYIPFSFHMDGNDQIEIQYAYNQEQIIEYQKTLEAIKTQYLNNIKDMNEIEVIDYTYQYLFKNIVYDHDAFESDDFNRIDYHHEHNIIKALTEGTCVCAGYATSFQYLLNAANYQCLLVKGKGRSSNGDHAWDLLEVDDQFYYFDPTWDDQESGFPLSYYIYYGNNYQQMERGHIFENCAFENITSTKMNYAECHGYLLSSLEEIPMQIESQKGNEIIILKFKDHDLYEQAIDYINQHYMEIGYGWYEPMNTIYLNS